MHPEPQSGHPASPPGGGYEKSDLSVKAIGVFGAILTLVLVLAIVSMAWMFGLFAAREERQDAPPSPLATAGSGPPQPLLQVDAPRDLKELRAAEDARLASYGWVDKQAGLARIPIDRAMALLAERGLPSPPEPAATGKGPAGRGGRR